jgi:hypothetical protein
MATKLVDGDALGSNVGVIDGEAELLEGFEFNSNGKLGTTIYAPFTTIIDRVAGKLTVNIPVFVPIIMVAAPGGSTHFKIVSTGAEIDAHEMNTRCPYKGFLKYEFVIFEWC